MMFDPSDVASSVGNLKISQRNGSNLRKKNSSNYFKMACDPRPNYQVLPRPYRVLIERARYDYDRMVEFAWDKSAVSSNIDVMKDDPLTVYRYPTPQSTDAARGKTVLTHGTHIWDIAWAESLRGTHPVIGVCTANAPLHADGYTDLIGGNLESWGWNMLNCTTHYGGFSKKYPPSSAVLPVGGVSGVIRCILDMDEGTLAFHINGTYLGIAFNGLKGKQLYPAISAVWGNCAVTMRHVFSGNS